MSIDSEMEKLHKIFAQALAEIDRLQESRERLRLDRNRLLAAAKKVIEQADRETNAFRELRAAITAAEELVP